MKNSTKWALIISAAVGVVAGLVIYKVSKDLKDMDFSFGFNDADSDCTEYEDFKK